MHKLIKRATLRFVAVRLVDNIAVATHTVVRDDVHGLAGVCFEISKDCRTLFKRYFLSFPIVERR